VARDRTCFLHPHSGAPPVAPRTNRSLTRLAAADTAGVDNGSLDTVAWSADGARLVAGGPYQIRGDHPIRLWDQGGRGRAREVAVSQNTLLHLVPCGAGWAVGATDPAFGLLSATGKKRLWQTGVIADRRGTLGDAFTLSAEGGQVRFGLGVGGQAPVLFDLRTQRLTEAPSPVPGLAAPDTTSLTVSNWEDKVSPKARRHAAGPPPIRDLPRPRHRPGPHPLRAWHRVAAPRL